MVLNINDENIYRAMEAEGTSCRAYYRVGTKEVKVRGCLPLTVLRQAPVRTRSPGTDSCWMLTAPRRPGEAAPPLLWSPTHRGANPGLPT